MFGYMFDWLLGLVIVGAILFFIFSRVRFRIPGLSPLSLFLAILIFIAATILFNVIWSDLTELVRPKGVAYYYQDLFSRKVNELLVHTLYVVPLLVIAIIFYVNLEKKGVKYRTITFPYFVAAGIMVIRLLAEASYLAIEHFEKAGIYGVLIFALAIFTALIFYIQRKWEERKKEEIRPPGP